MTAFLALTRVYLRGLLMTTLGSSRTRKKKSIPAAAALLLMGLIMLTLSVTYAWLFASSFAPLGGLDVMLMLMLMLSIALPTLFVLFLARGVIYNTKDMDLALSLPVSHFTLMMARMAALYLETLFMLETVLLPAGIFWLVYGGSGGVGFLLLLLVMGLFLAFIPCLLGMVISGVATLITSRLPFKNLFYTLLMLAALVGVFGINFATQSAAPEMGDNLEPIRAAFADILPLHWALQALTGPSILHYVLVAALCVLPFLLFTWLFSKVYLRLLTSLASHTVRKDYKLRAIRASSPLPALLKKEARRFFGTPAYLFNAGIGVLMMLLAAVGVFLYRGPIMDALGQMAAMEGAGMLTEHLPALVLGCMLFLLAMVYPASVSFNLEGKNIWLLKSAPLLPQQVFLAKGGFQFLLCAVASLVCMPFIALTFRFTAVQLACILLVCLFQSALLALWDVSINLRFPRMDADTEIIAIKQSSSAMFALLACLVSLVIDGVVYGVSAVLLGLGFAPACLLVCAVTGALALLSAHRLRTAGPALFEEL